MTEIPLSEIQLAQLVLIDGGLSADEAAAQLVSRPQMTGELAGPIAAKRAEFEADIERAKAEAEANTPAGRAEAARETAKAVREREALVADARILLEAEGKFAGMDLDGLSDVEILHHARIEPQPSLLTTAEKDAAALSLVHSGEWQRLSVNDRIQASLDLGVSEDAMDSYAASLSEAPEEEAV